MLLWKKTTFKNANFSNDQDKETKETPSQSQESTAGNLLKLQPLPHWLSPLFPHVLGGKNFVAQ